MKFVFVMAVVAVLTGCGTIGGAVSGAGDDLKGAGEYIRNVGK
jgi:hypothetical protein